MWMGPFTILNLLGLLTQVVFVQNILLATFLGMCTFLACSTNLKTANGLGIAVVLVMGLTAPLNWLVHTFITGDGALTWLSYFGIDGSKINLSFLELITFISVIAALVQILEIVIEKVSPQLYTSLGTFLPLITVNCAILGACLLAVTKDYPFVPNFVYVLGSGIGWWLAIALIAAIREKLTYSHIPKGLQGMGITFVTAGLIAMVFMGLQGIFIDRPTGNLNSEKVFAEEVVEAKK